MAAAKKAPKGPRATPVDLSFAHAKLASSGLSEAQGAMLGMRVVDAAQLDPAFHPIKALQLPYHDLDGTLTGFYRLRYLKDLPGFAGAIAKPQRYTQPAGTLNWVYLPKLAGIDWQAIAKDATVPLLVTEGELKAACACVHGSLCIALGGVTVWQSSKKKVPLLPPLDQFNWKGRHVTVIFDSDAAVNAQVAQAQARFAMELLRLGAVPAVAALPSRFDGSKQGLDDFLVAGGDLQAVIDAAAQPALASALVALNERFAYLGDQDVVVEFATARRLKRDAFINGLLANHQLIEFKANARTAILAPHTTSVPKTWLEWNCRHSVGTLEYAPGQPQLGSGNYNLWTGWGCVPKEGDVRPWVAFLDFLFGGCAEERRWFEQWLAYPLQHPGAKLYAAAVLWGPETGTGKSLVGYTMGRIYGKNFVAIGNSELHSPFNEWAPGKQFVLGDEITGTDKRNEADRLKQLITQQQLRVNMKHLPVYEVQDCLNYYFTSNHPDAFFIDDQERRYFVHRVPEARRGPEFYEGYMKWLNNGGAGHLFHHLLSIDLTGFNPTAPAMETESKREMVDHAKSDVASFVKDLLRNHDRELRRLQELLSLPEAPELALNKHLRLLYDPEGQTRVTANGLGRELTRAGLKTLAPIKTAAFGVQRFYVLTNTADWVNATPDAVRDYIDKVYKGAVAKKY